MYALSKNIRQHKAFDPGITAVLLALATLISYLFTETTQNTTNVAVVYMLCVVLVARYTSGHLWGVLASVAGVIGVNFFFTYPFMQLDFTRSGYPITFIGMLAISLITSAATAQVKEQARITAEREKVMQQLNEISRSLLTAEDIPQIITLTLDYLYTFTGSPVILYTEDPIMSSGPAAQPQARGVSSVFLLKEERQAAHQAYVSGRPSGIGTANPLSSSCLYLPFLSGEDVLSVLGIGCAAGKPLRPDALTFLNLMIPQVVMAMEKQRLSDTHQKLAIESEKEKTRANLLRAVSHDLRTPLTSMIGSSATYLGAKDYLSESDKDALIGQIHEDSNWLLNMVENLLTVTRINNENANVNKHPEPLEEVVSEAVLRLKKRLPQAAVTVHIPADFLMVSMDATLIEQVIINLLENAVKHSHTDRPIELNVTEMSDHIRFEVKDYGTGLREDLLPTLFDGSAGYESGSSDASKGMGIGLSICKTIIHSHGGTITAANHPDGAVFTFTLPYEGESDYGK